MRRQWALFLAAVQFLTRVPLREIAGFQPDWTARSARWFPLVGALVGVVCASVLLAAGQRLTGVLPALLAVAAGVAVTGAFHEDGLADSADGLGGGSNRARRLEIMKDSRIGTYGALALLLSVLIRAAAIAGLPPRAWFALVSVHIWARVGPVRLLATEPYVDRPDAKSRGLFQTRPLHVAVALSWGVAGVALAIGVGWLTPRAAYAAAFAPLLASVLLGRYFRKRIGGVTGDLLGAAEQVGEIVAWLAISTLPLAH